MKFFFFLSFQATIGIDFLSKTMYLEDRTVSKIFLGTSLCTVGARISICCDGAGIARKDKLSLHLPAASRLTELCRQLPSPLGEGGNRFTLNPFSFWRIQRSFAKCCRFVASSLVLNLTYLNRKRLPSVVTHKLHLLLACCSSSSRNEWNHCSLEESLWFKISSDPSLRSSLH